MAKTHTPKRSMAILTPNICDSFSGNPGDTVQWQNIPAGGCTVSQNVNNPWPFSPASPITLPLPVGVTVTIAVRPAGTTTYSYNLSCCPAAGIRNVTVS
jgi:hypothetical protein